MSPDRFCLFLAISSRLKRYSTFFLTSTFFLNFIFGNRKGVLAFLYNNEFLASLSERETHLFVWLSKLYMEIQRLTAPQVSYTRQQGICIGKGLVSGTYSREEERERFKTKCFFFEGDLEGISVVSLRRSWSFVYGFTVWQRVMGYCPCKDVT